MSCQHGEVSSYIMLPYFNILEKTTGSWEYMGSTVPGHRLLDLAFQPCVGKQRITYNPSFYPRSYEVIRPESASRAVISDKQGQWIFSQAITHFSNLVHNWWRPRSICPIHLDVIRCECKIKNSFPNKNPGFIKVSWLIIMITNFLD